MNSQDSENQLVDVIFFVLDELTVIERSIQKDGYNNLRTYSHYVHDAVIFKPLL
jgi:hypothetical protein